MKTYNTFLDDNEILSGTERYPIIGDLIEQDLADKILTEFVGLKRYWDCLEKAQITKRMTDHLFNIPSVIILGALDIHSVEPNCSYGFDFNLPYEFHAWVLTDKGIIDTALPGVIEKGLNTSDHVGPSLIGRKPYIIATDKKISWIVYTAHSYASHLE